MKVGDLIKVPHGVPRTTGYKISGQLGVLIEELRGGGTLYLQWRVLVGGDIYWLYPGELEVVNESR
tara:strand:+ start:390 stop:587 length:198 start_codon:yes stop_codon:yes gene_type:complete